MTLASLRARARVHLDWTARWIAAHPKPAPGFWLVSLVVVAWML